MLREEIYRKFAVVPSDVVGGIGILGTVVLAVASFCPSPWKWLSLGAGVLISLVGATVGILRSKGRDSERVNAEEACAELLSRMTKERAHLLKRDLLPLIQLVAETIEERDPQVRRANAQAIRHGVVNAAAAVVAPAVPEVRAFLFKKSSRRMKMDCSCGGRTRRTFKPGDRTWEVMLAAEVVLIEGVVDEPYVTYIIMPVISGGEPVVPHGVLTIDAPGEGDLTAEEYPLIEFLAAIAAVGYRLENL